MNTLNYIKKLGDGREVVIPHKLIRAYIDEYPTVQCNDVYYQYMDKMQEWQSISEKDLLRQIARYLNKHIDGKWCVNLKCQVQTNLSPEIPTVKQMSPRSNLIPLENCAVDIRTGKARKKRKEDYFLFHLPIKYNKKAKCPRFNRFLREICNYKKQRRLAIEEIMGYCLSYETRCQKAFYFYGTGANGKSVLMNIMQELIGRRNYVVSTPKSLQSQFGCGKLENAKTLFVTDLEQRDLQSLTSGIMKQIIAGDEIRAEIKYKEEKNFKSRIKVVVSSNFSLDFSGDDSYGAKRRYLIIPFEHQVSPKNRDIYLEDKLKKELPGIFNLAMHGYQRLMMNDYIFSYQKFSDRIQRRWIDEDVSFTCFVKQKIVRRSNGFLSYDNLKNKYVEWAGKKGQEFDVPASVEMGKIIKSRFNGDVYSKKKGGHRGIVGIGIA